MAKKRKWVKLSEAISESELRERIRQAVNTVVQRHKPLTQVLAEARAEYDQLPEQVKAIFARNRKLRQQADGDTD